MIYTTGFWRKTPEQIRDCAADLGVYVVDVRTDPWPGTAIWRPGRLKVFFGVLDARYRYVWAGQWLGVRGGSLIAPYAAVRPLRPLHAARGLLLLCSCQRSEICHRADAAAYLAGVLHDQVEHL